MNLSTCCLYLFILWEQILKAASDTTEGTREGRYSYILLLHLQRHLKPFWTKHRLKKITQECELNKNTSKCVSLTHTCTTWALLPCEKNISNAHFCEKKKKIIKRIGDRVVWLQRVFIFFLVFKYGPLSAGSSKKHGHTTHNSHQSLSIFRWDFSFCLDWGGGVPISSFHV